MARLSIVATPIGNLQDITLRALRTLKEADVIYCEDTRVTRKLLDRYEIKTPLRRLDANTEPEGAKEIIERLERGEHIAYATDAGTPGVSDPGYRLVAAVREYFKETSARSDLAEVSRTEGAPRNLSVGIEAIPGPSAVTAALSIAGVPADQFLFLGFLPHKKGRQTLLKKIAQAEMAIVLYESSHRILKLLKELEDAIPERQVIVAREITKKFEEVQKGTAGQLYELFEKEPEHRKGEFVVILSAR